MLFDAMNDDARIVEVYDKVVTFKFQGGQAYRITSNGGAIPIDYNTALLEIERHKERDGRHYSHALPMPYREVYMWLALLCFAVVGAAVFFLWFTW